MTIKRLLAICLIVGCTSAAWFLLGGAVQYRSTQTDGRLGSEVVRNWGPLLTQEHPSLFYEAPTGANARREIQPENSDIAVTLTYEPKQKGLLWYRTYKAVFTGTYLVKNPTPIAQTIYAAFKFPAADARYDAFSLRFGDKLTDKAPVNGEIRESLLLKPGEEVPLTVVKSNGYREPFDRVKLVAGISAACKGRPVSAEQIDQMGEAIEDEVRLQGPEVPTAVVGVEVLERLRRLDEVAYLRFASVYKGFDAAADFQRELVLLKKLQRS